MYAPGAVQERLARGELPSHGAHLVQNREYVEGTDDKYQTSSLTAPDCAFNRFGHEASRCKTTLSLETYLEKTPFWHAFRN